MKVINSLILLISLIALYSCNFKSDHPQADLVKNQSFTGMDDKSILAFADSINKTLNTFEKRYSLIYMLGDNSLYVERYTKNLSSKVYDEHINSDATGSALNKYYFKNDSLVLVEINNEQTIEKGRIFKDTRIYLRNNIVFKKETRTASSAAALKKSRYLLVQAPYNQPPEENYIDNIKVLDDAVQQDDKFEMVFDNITTYPDSRYLILKSKIQNSYKASILIENKDSFIDSLLTHPSAFKDEKLKFKWKIRNEEAVYVPESANITSASGLNK